MLLRSLAPRFAAALLCLFFTAAAPAATPTATIDLPGKAKWNRLTSLGLLLVGTDDALLLVDGESGKTLWKRDDIKKTVSYNVRELEGSPIILVNDWTGLIGAKVTAQGLDVATGQTVYRTEPEPGLSLGLYPSPDGRFALNISQLFNDGGIFATYFEAATGKQVWRTKIAGMNGIPLHMSDNSGVFNVRQDLSGHQDPVYDGDAVYLPYKGLMALDLASGSIKWNVEYATADQALKRAYSAPVIDGDTIFASGKGTVYAIDKASGTVKWKSDKVTSGFFGSGVISQVLPTPDAVYVRLGGNFYDQGQKAFVLKEPLGVMELDRASGAKNWEYKGAKEGITNLVLVPSQNSVMVSDAYKLTGLDLDSKGKGSARFDVPLEFKRQVSGGEMAAAGVSAVSGFLTGGLAGALKGGLGATSSKSRLDVPVALMPQPDGKVLVIGKQHLMRFDPAAKKIDWSTYYPAPGSSGLGLAAMSAVTLVAATGYMAQQAQYGYSAFNSSDKSNQQMYGSLNSYAAKRYQASKQARDHSYVLTNVTEGKTTGVGLLAISLATGEPGAQVLLNDKEPEYAVDELTGRLYYFNDKKQIQVYSLK